MHSLDQIANFTYNCAKRKQPYVQRFLCYFNLVNVHIFRIKLNIESHLLKPIFQNPYIQQGISAR